jgi:class 3 adenylate cyclase
VLSDQRDLLRDAFAHCHGHEIDTQGDAFFVAFPRAVDALNCVMEARQALAKHAWPNGVAVRVRMGLHTGEPIVARTGYVGMDVHRAARIAAASHGGQVLHSQTTRDLIYQDLPLGTTLRALGEFKLKDIRFAQPLYQLDIAGLPSDFGPLKTLSSGEEPPTPGEPPFKGLQYFDEADAGGAVLGCSQWPPLDNNGSNGGLRAAAGSRL